MKTFNAKVVAVIFLVFYTVASTNAAPTEVEKELSAPQLKGQHTAEYWGFKLFNAELWTNQPGKFSLDQPFALTLSYLNPFSKEFLAWSSIKEIARVEGNSPKKYVKLEQQLRNCLISVRKGMRITGIAESVDKVALYVNGQKSCTVHYPNLRERFFGIWLAPTSRDTRGAQSLRGSN